MKNFLKKLLFAFAPKRMAVIQSIRSRKRSHKLVQEWGILNLNKKLKAKFGNKVQTGPFAGMNLPEESFKEHIGPYLLGTYESELTPIWPAVFGRQYEQIIDIGSKFGFYAVGLALKYPRAQVTAFDIDPWAQKATRAMAGANGISNLETLGFCEPLWIKKNLKKNALLVSDCEGFEKIIFSAELGPNLDSLTAIIETHDNLVPGSSERVLEAFESTHEVLKLNVPEKCKFSKELDSLTEEERCTAMREIRGVQDWLFCLPKEQR